MPNEQIPVFRGFAPNRLSGNARKAATGYRQMPLFCRLPSHHSRTIVGASLLAKAACQPMQMQNVTASSRASSLPQGLLVLREFLRA
ncbi:hypothetical protein F8N49_08325 [Pseudomonas sp. GXM4]|nr:hypothetical protein F8N49_08325 [Pseudomonas sp. GXM4]